MSRLPIIPASGILSDLLRELEAEMTTLKDGDRVYLGKLDWYLDHAEIIELGSELLLMALRLRDQP